MRDGLENEGHVPWMNYFRKKVETLAKVTKRLDRNLSFLVPWSLLVRVV